MSLSAGPSDKGDRLFVLEREVQNLQLKNNMLQEFSDKLRTQLHDSESALQNCRQEYFDVTQDRDNLKHDFENLRGEVEKLREEKLDMFEMLKQKNSEITSLKDTLQSIQSNDLIDLEKSKNSSLNEIRLKEIKLGFLDNRLRNEKNLYQNQVELLSKELEDKTNELLNIRKENNEKMLEANMKIEEQANEISSLKIEMNRLKKLNESKDSKNEDLSQKLFELQFQFNQLGTTHDKETEAQNDMINLLMKRVEDIQKESQEKDKANEELRELLKKGYEAHSEVELQFESMKESYLNDVRKLEEERQNLAEKLEDAQMYLIEYNKTNIEKQFEKHFPIAHETNKKLNNVVNLSDLYDELVKTKQELTRVTTAKLKLENQVRELSEKVDEDKPLLFKNMHEYQMMEQNYQKLNDELTQLLMEKDNFMSEKDMDTQTINALEREIKRYQLETQDLSRQVTYLLKCIQEERGFQVCEDPGRTQESDIASNLIVFRDIQELQEKNRQLLVLLHEMDNELGKKDPSEESPEVNELRSQIENYKKELENMRKELDKKNEILELTSKQNRLFNPALTDFNPIQIVTENKELKAKLEKLSEELDNIRKNNLEDIRRLENDKNDLIRENAAIKSDLSRAHSELQTQNNQLEAVNLTLDKFQSENINLRERNIKLNSVTENLEKNILTLKNQIDKLNETIKMKDQNLEFKNAELNQIKNDLDFLLKENALHKNEALNQMKIVESLKAMQENCNKAEDETIRNQAFQIERLEKEIMYYRERIEKQDEKWKETIESFSSRLHNLQDMLDKERTKYLQLQQEHYDLKVKMQSQQSVQTNDAVQEIEPQPRTSASGLNGKKELQIVEDEIKILKGKLANSEEKCQNLQMINNNLEANLNKLVQKNDEIKTSVDSEIQSKIDQINALNQELQKIREHFESIIGEKDSEINRLKQQTEEYAKQVRQLNTELEHVNKALEKAHQNEHEVLNDIKIQSIIAEKAQKDYEEAMESRNTDARTIFGLQVDLEKIQKQFSDRENECDKLRSELKASTEMLEKERNSLTQDIEKLRIRCATLEQVNDSLSNQIEQLNDQIIGLQNNSNVFMLNEDQQKENANRLLTVVKFLRDEKSQLEMQLSKINDENSRFKIEIENYKKEIENLKSVLQFEKESATRLNNLAEFKEVMAKAQMVPVLSENNAQLKAQVSQLEKRCNELVDRLKSYELKEKSLQDLSSKTTEEVMNVELLKKELENWKLKAQNLAQQLRNFDADSVKRLMNEKAILSKQVQINAENLGKVQNEKDILSKQIQINAAEYNKLKVSMEAKTRSLLANEQELNNIKQQLKEVIAEKENYKNEFGRSQNELINLKNVNVQLRSLARKYKTEIGKIKTSGSDSKTGEAGDSGSIESMDKETQCESQPEISQEKNDQMKEFENRVSMLNNDVQRLNNENEMLKRLVSEKEEYAKKIAVVAQQAKLRLSDLSTERNNLIKEKENLEKTLNETQMKVSQLESNVEYVSKLKTHYDSQINQQQKELETANKQIEDLTSQLNQQPVSKPSKAPMIQITTTSPSNKAIAPSVSTTPVRHSVLPQQQPSTSGTTLVYSSKPTPTVSIKPMTVSVPQKSSRFGQVIGKICPTESSASVPQATVQPTQAHSVSNPSSTSVSSSIPSTSQADVEVSEASTSQTQSVHPPVTGPKRGLDNTSFDEPSSSNYKKVKTNVISVESDEEPGDIGNEMLDQYETFVLVEAHPEPEHPGGDVDADDFREDTESQNKMVDEEEAEGIENEINDEIDELMEEEEADEENEPDEEDEENLDEEENVQELDERSESVESEPDDMEQDDEESVCLDEEEGDEEEDEEQANDKIEVIALSSSEEEVDNSNDVDDIAQTTDNNVSEVTSSHVSSNNQTVMQNLATTTNDDSNEAPQMDSSGSMNVVTSQSTSRVSDSEAATSMALSSTSHPSTSEMACSTSTSANVTSQNVPRQPRRPVLWDRGPSRTANTPQRGGHHTHSPSSRGNANSRTMRTFRRGINRNRRNFGFK